MDPRRSSARSPSAAVAQIHLVTEHQGRLNWVIW
jgi:hypothetical protein